MKPKALPGEVCAPFGATLNGYHPPLDGLRAIAVTSVVVFHAAPNLLPGGWWGVDLFFVLSGFLITSLLMQETARFGSIDRLAFYARRALRLWPAFLLVLAFCAVLAIGSKNPDQGLTAVAISGLYLMNWNRAFKLYSDVGLGHTWSLAMEEQFYLVWPFILALILPRRPLLSVGALILAVICLRLGMVAAGVGPERTYNGFDTHSDGLLIGAALAMLNTNGWMLRWLIRTAPFAVPAALALYALPVEMTFTQAIGTTLTAVVSAGLIVLSLTSAPSRWALSLAPLQYTGKISYGWYLWHIPVLTLGLHRLPHFPAIGFALVTAAFAIAALSYHFVERPLLRLKGRFAPAKVRQAAPVARSTDDDRKAHELLNEKERLRSHRSLKARRWSSAGS